MARSGFELLTNSGRFRSVRQADRGRSWSTGRALLGVAIACAVALGGCGGGDDEDKPAGVDLTAVRCPMVAAGEQGGVTKYEPAPDSFDTATLIGSKVSEAEAEAAKHGCDIVVALEDGAGVPVPTDVDPMRIYVYTEDGVVTEIEGVGGGI
jgi:hypothetical protein